VEELKKSKNPDNPTKHSDRVFQIQQIGKEYLSKRTVWEKRKEKREEGKRVLESNPADSSRGPQVDHDFTKVQKREMSLKKTERKKGVRKGRFGGEGVNKLGGPRHLNCGKDLHPLTSEDITTRISRDRGGQTGRGIGSGEA